MVSDFSNYDSYRSSDHGIDDRVVCFGISWRGSGDRIWLQFAVFVILSFLSMIVFRPIAMRFFNPVKEKTNIDEIIGKKAVVIESIDNLQGTGKVRYQGMEWTARAEEENDRIEKDAEVEIIAVKGVKLIVKMKG